MVQRGLQLLYLYAFFKLDASQRHASAGAPPVKRPGIHCIQDAGSGPGWVRKSPSSPRFDSRTLQPVLSRYTD